MYTRENDDLTMAEANEILKGNNFAKESLK